MTNDLCEKCGLQPATENFSHDGGVLALAHAFYQRWCRRCVAAAQLAHAHACMRHIPALEAELDLPRSLLPLDLLKRVAVETSGSPSMILMDGKSYKVIPTELADAIEQACQDL